MSDAWRPGRVPAGLGIEQWNGELNRKVLNGPARCIVGGYAFHLGSLPFACLPSGFLPSVSYQQAGL